MSKKPKRNKLDKYNNKGTKDGENLSRMDRDAEKSPNNKAAKERASS